MYVGMAQQGLQEHCKTNEVVTKWKEAAVAWFMLLLL